jgi:predicted  nucleic acid-binding Zn-ribbon protein
MSSIKHLTQQISELSQELVACQHKLSNWEWEDDKPVNIDDFYDLEDKVDDLESKILDLEEDVDNLINLQYQDDDEL